MAWHGSNGSATQHFESHNRRIAEVSVEQLLFTVPLLIKFSGNNDPRSLFPFARFFILCPSFLRFGQGPSLSEKPLTVKEVLLFFQCLWEIVDALVRSLAGLCWEQVGCEFQRFDWNRCGFHLALLPAEFPHKIDEHSSFPTSSMRIWNLAQQ